ACNAASQSNPFATVSAALLCATSGSTVNLSAGTFDGQVTINRNLVLQGAGAATVIRRTPGYSNLAPNVTVAEGRTVTLRNLTVDGVDQTTAGVVAGSGRLTLRDVNVINNGNHSTSGHHNLIGQSTGAATSGCAGFTHGTNGNLVGTAATPIDPTLGPLANNGGPTLTRALLSGSPAINNGDATDCQTTPVNNLD